MPADRLEVTDRTKLAGAGGGSPYDLPPARVDPRFAAFAKGQLVRHPTFGLGRIAELIDGSQPKVNVDFNAAGRKTLVLEYAKLVAVR